nr:hypothetical protein [uncultured archaeon]
MREINLLEKSHPQPTKRRIEPGWRTAENKIIARRYDKEFFDGDRVNGYGGYYYDGRWRYVAEELKKLYGINNNSAVLDIGCAKGFLLYDLQDMIPGIKVAGIDISEYAINKAVDGYANFLIKNQSLSEEKAREKEEETRKKVLPHMIVGNCEKLPWPDNSFDVVLSINTTHNLPIEKCKKAIQEMIRVCKNKKSMFIQVDAYRTPEEKQRMRDWILTGEVLMSVDEWIEFFKKCGYGGDYYWTIF